MRLRVAAPLLLVVVIALGLLVTPVLAGIADRRTTAIELERRQAITQVAELAQVAIEDDDPVPLQRHLDRYHQLFGESVLVVDPAGTVLARVGELDPEAAAVEQRIRDFGTNLEQLEIPTVVPWSPERTLLSVPVAIERDLSGGVVVLQVDLDRARRVVLTSWLTILGLTSVGLLALALATLWATSWILRPVHRLDEATHALTTGAPVPDLALTGPPELRRLAGSFQLMAHTLAATVDQQRALLANTSHQLRNPLAAVRLHVDLMAGSTVVDHGSVEAVQRDLDRLDATIDRLLGLAEAEHRLNEDRAALALREGGPPLASATTAPGVLVRHVAERWAGDDRRRITVSSEASAAIAVPEHDLVEMVDTLLHNAVKYAGDGAHIRLSVVEASPGRVEVEVEDDGTGLTDDELAHVGERFWRSSRHADHPGTGLGLAIVDTLARAHGGTMTATRSGTGGLAVLLDLPREEAT